MAALDLKDNMDPENDDSGDIWSEPEFQQDGLKEFERLDSLLSQVPKKAQHGILKSCDLVLTCIDANTKFIALGTNIGTAFLYSRRNETMQRLKATNHGAVITSICLHDGVDDLVAVGCASGEVTIFCIPGLVSVQKKQIQKFEVRDVHKHFITCLEWSTNGMKLFSGDKMGQVAVTEIDFYQGLSKSCSLLIEPSTEIIQLDYHKRMLLVSTRQRSFVVRLDRYTETIQIGSKDRKMPGQFGACFIPELCKPDDVKLYAARPGCRLWLADTQGTVKSTHIFKDPLSHEVPEIPLLAAGKLQLQQEGFQFGKLLWMHNRSLISWSSSALVVLDPVNNRCLCRQSKLSGVVDVAVVSETKEVFLLRRHADARVIRISTKPEALIKDEIKPLASSSGSAPENEDFTFTKAERKEELTALSLFKKISEPLKKHFENGLNEFPPVMEILPAEFDSLCIDLPPGVTATPIENNPPPAPISKQGPPDFPQKIEAPITETNEDIVFTHKMKKNKKKKYKPDSYKGKEPELDTVSQQSYDSVGSSNMNASFNSEDESTLKTLNEADKMLSIVQNIISKESASKSEPLPDVLPMVSASVDSDILEFQNDQAENVIPFSDQVKAPDSTPVAKAEAPTSLKDQSKSEKSGYESSCNMVSQLATENNPEDNVSQNVYKNVLTDSVVISSQNRSDNLPETDKENQGSDKYGNNQHLCDPSLSEVDQHMEVTPGYKDTSLFEKSVSEVNFPKHSDLVDSVLARVTGVNHGQDDLLKEDIPDHLPQDFPSCEKESVGKPKKDKKERFPLLNQQSVADIYMDLDSIEDLDYFRRNEQGENTTEDFYSKYLDENFQEESNSSTTKTKEASSFPEKFVVDTHSQDIKKTASHIANSWSEITAPANIYSLAVSDNHLWFTDKSENIYYSLLQGAKGIVWRKATGYASQISVSPSGSIVWRLCKGVVFAGTKISTRHPEGLKWVEAVREVQYIAVSNTCAWYIKRTGELMLQQGLSKERPCYRSRQIDCGPYRLKQVACGGQGVVWCITESLQLLVRTGVRRDLPAGDAWEICVRDTPPYLFSHVTIDNENVGWAIDVSGRVWFCQGVTLENPRGTSDWFEVPMSGYVMQDASMLDTIRAAAKIFDPSKLSYIMSTNRGGLVSAGPQGIWLAMDFRNLLQVCRGTIQGYHWMEAQPARMAASTSWKHVCASMNHFDHGLVWAQHVKHDIFAFKKAHGEAHNIVDCGDLVCISVAPLALWTLSSDGEIRVRTGMGPGCPQGIGWVNVNLAQLGDAHFVHLSCNASYIWAVEAQGGVYQRIGTGPPSNADLNPVWLPIDTIGDLCFTKIFVSALDWMVWGIDNRRLCFVRVGITESMPLGREWIHVPGIQAIDMAITKTGIWALNTQGEIFFRYGIALDNPTGDYWKKIPGALTKISASEDDELWGINLDGQLMCCKFKLLPRRQKSTEAFPAAPLTRDMSVNEDWEIV